MRELYKNCIHTDASCEVRICISDFAYFLAQRVQPEGGFFSLYICMAYVEGHTAIKVEASKLFPAVASIFTREGQKYLSEEVLCGIEKEILYEIFHKKYTSLIEKSNFYMLPRPFYIEKNIAEHVQRLASVPRTWNGCVKADLQEEQLSAVQGSAVASFSLITGGPGTGKTFTAGVLLTALLQDEKICHHIALLAPTGRAASKLSDSILRCIKPQKNLFITSSTIHKALMTRSTYLPYDIILVDEASMIDAEMFSQLVSRVHSGTQVILLGDINQLPPVEAGSPFFDLVSHIFPHVRCFSLKRCMRTDNLVLLQLASHVVSRNWDAFFSLCQEEQEALFYTDISRKNAEEIEHFLYKTLKSWENLSSPQEALSLLTKIAILAPSRKGILGVDFINDMAKKTASRYMPIVATKNRYDLKIMNADLGIYDREKRILHFSKLSIPDVLYPDYELAYAMTVHKSQGSEFEHVLVLIPENIFCTPSLIYTACTRAKKQLHILCHEPSLKKILSEEHTRVSALPQFRDL